MAFIGLTINSIEKKEDWYEVLMTYRTKTANYYCKMVFEKLPHPLQNILPNYLGKKEGRNQWQFGNKTVFEARHRAGRLTVNLDGRYFQLIELAENAQFGY